MKRSTQNALILLAMGHLALVVCGAAYVDWSRLGPAGGAARFYGQLSGAGRSYGFFAPGVGTQVRARFEVVDGAGHSREYSLLDGSSHEADLRIGNIIDQFLAMDDDDDDLRRALAASLAGTFFGRHADARDVTLHLDEFAPVSMADFRGGARADWDEIYSARFRHDVPATAAVAP